MSALADLVANVAADLRDSTSATWTAAELTRAIRWSLHELSWAVPRRVAVTLTTHADLREYSLAAAGVSDRLFLAEVWYPYTAADPEYPPRAVAWRLLDDDTLFLDVATIAEGETVRLFYARAHTVQGLDGAPVTTLSGEQEELVCLGAAGYAVLQRAQDAIGQVNLTGQAPSLWREWGERRLHTFRTRLDQLARRVAAWRAPWVEGWRVE